MSESQSQTTGINEGDLLELDLFVKNPKNMEDALGNKMDTLGDDERLERAALVLFGREIDQAVDNAKEGEPGFVYAEARRKIRATLEASLRKAPPQTAYVDKTITEIPKPVIKYENVVTRPVKIQKSPEGEWRQLP